MLSWRRNLDVGLLPQSLAVSPTTVEPDAAFGTICVAINCENSRHHPGHAAIVSAAYCLLPRYAGACSQRDMAVPSDKTVFLDETLSTAQEEIGKLIDNSPSCIYLVDVDLRFLHASEGARTFYGEGQALIGKPLYEVLRTVWDSPFAREIVGRFRKTLETGEHYFAARETVWRKDVPTIVVRDWRIDRVSLADGQYGVVCQFRDVSHERKLESALRDTEERLAAQLTAVFRLNELSKITIPVGKIETLYEYMLDAATALMHSEFASLQLLESDDSGNEVALRLLAHRGFHDESARHWQLVYPGTWSTCGVAFRIRKRFAISDIEQ